MATDRPAGPAASTLFIGLISGTSVDAVDAVLADCSQRRPRVLDSLEFPWPEALRAELLAAGRGRHRLDAAGWGALGARTGSVMAAATRALLDKAGLESNQVRAIGSHGQTLFHAPDANPAFSVQIGDPARIAAETGIDVVADFRAADLAAGGQGAPLAPLIHQILLADPGECRAVVNLGGIANVSVLESGAPVRGFDTGPANALLDAWCHRHTGRTLDAGGAWAASGRVIPDLLEAWLADPWFARPGPRSTGTETFNLDWLATKGGLEGRDPADVQATLVELSARSLADALVSVSAPDRVLLAGGGAANPVLVSAVVRALEPIPVAGVAEYGVDPDSLEALLMAWLADGFLAGRTVDTGPITGAGGPIRPGALYPAPG